MRVLMILPALTEATSPFFRPIKYALFPPLGLAQLAAYFDKDRDEVEIVDEHVMPAVRPERYDDRPPDLVVIQVYITNAYRSYALARVFAAMGCHVCLGGLHVTSLPLEARPHAHTLFLGPGEQTFPRFLRDLANGAPRLMYDSRDEPRTLDDLPMARRDLIDRDRYFVPNSIVVTRGCPHHCEFCYKDAFFEGGRGFYTLSVDRALAEIESLPGRHLYFLDDHLLGHRRFASALFDGMRGMGRVFQGASTVDAILRGDLIEKAAAAGLRSVFIGFESLDEGNLREAHKVQNLRRDYDAVVRRLDDLGVMINGSFVFGLDGDGPDVFERTVDWAVNVGITTATFHVATPYPGTLYHQRLARAGRITTTDWDLYDTRHAVFRPAGMTADQLEAGYWWAYRRFYRLGSIARSASHHRRVGHRLRHFAYAAAWKKLEPVWDLAIRTRRLRWTRAGLIRTLTGRRLPGAASKDVAQRDRADPGRLSLRVLDEPPDARGSAEPVMLGGDEQGQDRQR